MRIFGHTLQAGGRRLLSLLLLVPLAAVTLGAAPARQAEASHRQERPVIDVDYLYGQLYQMATSYIYRVSGEDGPPQDPSSRFNLPPTVNGWQEFYAYWKSQMTSERSMGPLASSVSVRDHFFRIPTAAGTAPFPFDSNVAEVTIPGASCAGQRVLMASHPDSTPTSLRVADDIDAGNFTRALQRIHSSNLGNGSPYDDTSGVTMGMAEFQALLRWYQANGTWPARTIKVGLFDAEETGLNGSQFYADHLIPAGPQGQYVLVANMDQNGLEYPAFHFGTDHYLNNLRDGGVGPWYTNINASPLVPNNIYKGEDFARIQANMPAIIAFRQALQDSVTEAFGVLGDKYHHSIPLENPLLLTQRIPSNPGPTTMPAYTAEDQQKLSPVQDDTLGRTDQVPFVAQGIPGYGVLGAFDSNENENPYPADYTEKPVISQYAGYDTVDDTIEHLNQWASGRPHGPKGVADPTEGLRRALELPSTWSSYLVAKDAYGGAAPRPQGPIAYFETDPLQPTDTTTVGFDGSFSTVPGGHHKLKYLWDFGDGSFGTGARVSHTYAGPVFADVKLVVVDGKRQGTYRQAVQVDGATGPAPATSACGQVSRDEAQAVIAASGRH